MSYKYQVTVKKKTFQLFWKYFVNMWTYKVPFLKKIEYPITFLNNFGKKTILLTVIKRRLTLKLRHLLLPDYLLLSLSKQLNRDFYFLGKFTLLRDYRSHPILRESGYLRSTSSAGGREVGDRSRLVLTYLGSTLPLVSGSPITLPSEKNVPSLPPRSSSQTQMKNTVFWDLRRTGVSVRIGKDPKPPKSKTTYITRPF